MENVLDWAVRIALMVHLAAIAGCVWRVWSGENVIDRLLAADLIGILVLSVLVLMALIFESSFYIDVALGLAALGFVGTIIFARYIAEERVF